MCRLSNRKGRHRASTESGRRRTGRPGCSVGRLHESRIARRDHEPRRIPRTRPSGTLSPDGGEGWGAGQRFMESKRKRCGHSIRQPAQHREHRDHHPSLDRSQPIHAKTEARGSAVGSPGTRDRPPVPARPRRVGPGTLTGFQRRRPVACLHGLPRGLGVDCTSWMCRWIAVRMASAALAETACPLGGSLKICFGPANAL